MQKKCFIEHIELSQSINLPLVIHNRNSDKELIDSLKKIKIFNGVVHCFASNLDLAYKLLKINLYLSFTGLITFVDELEKVIQNVPIDRIMIETDSPYLTPRPHRGKRNEPYMVKYVAEKIAEIKKTTIEEVARVTSLNAKDFFGI